MTVAFLFIKCRADVVSATKWHTYSLSCIPPTRIFRAHSNGFSLRFWAIFDPDSKCPSTLQKNPCESIRLPRSWSPAPPDMWPAGLSVSVNSAVTEVFLSRTACPVSQTCREAQGQHPEEPLSPSRSCRMCQLQYAASVSTGPLNPCSILSRGCRSNSPALPGEIRSSASAR